MVHLRHSWALLLPILAALLGLPLIGQQAAAPSGQSPRPQGVRPSPASVPASGPAGDFIIATYNINYGNPNLQAVAEAVEQSKADLIAFQETNAASEKYLRERLGGTYPHMVFRHAAAAGGFGFASKSPLRNTVWLPPKHGWFGTWVTEVRLGGAWVQVANVHLIPVNIRAKAGPKALLAAVAKVSQIQTREITRVEAALSGKVPAIILGDMNSPEDVSAPGYLVSRGFIDSLAAAKKDPADRTTWRWRRGRLQWRYRLDYIFHSPALSTRDSRVIPTEGSDHFLVVSTLGLSMQKPTDAAEAREAAAVTSRPADSPAEATSP